MKGQRRVYKLPRYYLSVGDYLKKLREKSGLTQRDVGNLLKYSSAQFISNFERGLSLPPLQKLKILQKKYRADTDLLIDLIIDAERAILFEGLRKDKRTPS